MNGQRYADDLEGQNDEALEGLSAKVKLLKDVSEFYLFTQLVQILNECLYPFSYSACFFLGGVGVGVRLPSALGTKCESRQYSSARW